MSDSKMNCVLLADRHQALSEGTRGLLGTMFGCVFAVAEGLAHRVAEARLRA